MRCKRGLSVPRSLGKRKTSPICGIARFRMPETARRFFHRMAPLVFIRQKFFCIKVALQKGPMLWRLVRKAACVLRRLVGERSAPQNGALFRAENQKAIERQVRPLASRAYIEQRIFSKRKIKKPRHRERHRTVGISSRVHPATERRKPPARWNTLRVLSRPPGRRTEKTTGAMKHATRARRNTLRVLSRPARI